MKAVILNGSRQGETTLENVHKIVLDELSNVGGEVQSFMLHDLDIGYCQGDFGCWIKTPGECIQKGIARDIARAFIQSDLVVYLTPITFGGYSSELKKAVDHLICLISPFFTKINGEVHHKPRYAHYPRVMAVGVLPQPDAEAEQIFRTLVSRNAINMHAPAHAAGVVVSSDGMEQARARIASLFAAVEVKQ
jgi:multimeric flavodoxin WrbA